ncbi:MAG: preprotein translocase subunit SecG [Acidimicrobiales bacterium]
MLTDILVGIEAASSLGLVLLILLHSGRGGGLSDMFGSSVGSAAAGSTVAERNLDRLTITVAVVFAFTSVIVGLRWG